MPPWAIARPSAPHVRISPYLLELTSAFSFTEDGRYTIAEEQYMNRKFNWLLASKRLYISLALLWSVMCTIIVFDSPGIYLGKLIIYFSFAFVAPVVLYFLGRWVYQGLVTQNPLD